MLTREALIAAIPHALDSVDVPGWGDKISGKVRDIYQKGDTRALIATDRVSAFDRILGLIPYRGQVLTQLSRFWFEHVSDIVNNHLIDLPDPNVMIVKEAQTLPVEVVVRGYITGVTNTSIWTMYEKGDRAPYGVRLPDGLKKNDPLPQPVITPTTKAEKGEHDEPLTRERILESKLIAPDLWVKIEQAALDVFRRGQEVAANAGLILVDTKYEFGLIDGELALIDEVHTPDSSRYWTAESYGQVDGPKHQDKEHLRKWFAAQGYTGDGQPPTMPPSFLAEMAGLYISTYEALTGQDFEPGEQPAAERIARNIMAHYA